MSHLRNFAKPRQAIVWRVVCRDHEDEKAAKALGYKLVEERLHGKLHKIAFSSSNKAEAAKHQQILNDTANAIRLPKGSDPIALGQKIRKERQGHHGAHQELRALTLTLQSQKRQIRY